MNTCLGSLIIEELVSLGVTDFCISPGSRSTPLTQAIALNPKTKKYIFIDERSSAFFALGLSKATGRATAIVTTSGTAISNGFPALIEASESCVPLLFISSDRPPELRRSGANQTIDQVKLFSDKVRFFADISPDVNHNYPNTIRSTLSEAIYHSSKAENKGPVHLNIMFREPFSHPKKSVFSSDTPFLLWEEPQRKLSLKQRAFLIQLLSKAQNPLLIIGNIQENEEQNAALNIAHQLNWPTIVDVSSGMSLFKIKNKISAFHLISEIDSVKHLLNFDLVLHLGGNTVIKNIHQRFKFKQYIQIDLRTKQHQPISSKMTRFSINISALTEITFSPLKNTPIKEVIKISEQCSKKINTLGIFSDFSVVSLLLSHLKPNHLLFISNSLPIRIVNRLHCNSSTKTTSNRGASGIDGTVSSALGWITGTKYHSPDKKGVLLIGDLSFWHELGALLHYQNEDLLIILLNNGGGGIFHFLPIAKQSSLLTKYFATHHQHSFYKIAESMGCEAIQVHSESEFEEALQKLLPQNNLRLIEIITAPQNSVDHNESYKLLLQQHLDALVSS
ncbi:MAG: 2-succinyl-5-enolpyruvyl-6-hydroxy-3-cyclohexene-1-carboxylic-acid synthase [Proteobacteria bacterium]|nr:2-succinyl-5-enolpyruvyl-6-hydroxy-3-cyclohexene-1-carboxylic-acid synthase [Pseudomonadota bacterium]